jgi:hypothetical protein
MSYYKIALPLFGDGTEELELAKISRAEDIAWI